ncbi:MAG: hypothetical protein ACRDHL_04390 [Candidatus Promineifilaceae bacterium]
MDRIYVFLIRNDVWLYIICFLGAIWYASQLAQARRRLRGAVFGLERERGQRLLRSSLAFVTFFLALATAVLYLNFRVAPGLPADLLSRPTPTPNPFLTPRPSLAPGETTQPPATTGQATLEVAPTVTLQGQPAAAPAETEASNPAPAGEDEPDSVGTPPAALGECGPLLAITSPPSGVTASGRVTFFGTAAIEGQSSYNLETQGPHTEGAWRSLFDSGDGGQVENAILGTADFSGWLFGDYVVRLVARDAQGEPLAECAIALELGSPAS